MNRFTSIVIVMPYAFADETRGTIQGRILDPKQPLAARLIFQSAPSLWMKCWSMPLK